MFGALSNHRARGADRFGRSVTGSSRGAPLTFRMEEDIRILTPAGCFQLPVPNIGMPTRES
jgi:hypothetical protein